MTSSSSGETAAEGAPPGPLLLSVSGLGRLTACEEKFLRTLDAGDDGQKSDALKLGTLMHELIQEDMLGRPWYAEWSRQLAEVMTDFDGIGFELEPPKIFLTAEWLMRRYEEIYGGEDLTTITVEVPFDLPLPGTDGAVRVRGYIDGLALSPRGLVLVELKTMGKWGKADRAKWESQVPTYLWAARQLGLPVVGCIFRAVYTYRWAAKDESHERPPADSFKDVWVPWSQEQETKVLRDFRNAGRRGLHLIENPDEALRTVGEACGWCPWKRDCLGLENL
jgi:hypothetical protein